MIGMDRAFRLPRTWSNEVLAALCPLFRGDVINVSGWKDVDKEGRRYRDYFTGASAYFVSNHAGRKGLADDGDITDFEIDLTAELPDDLRGRFDVVFNHTVLEHIFEVRKAFANLAAMTRDAMIVVVPFAQETHGPEYGDFWRFTPMTMRRMFEENGLSVVYENATPYDNAGIYLIFVGAQDAAKWKAVMPPWQELGKVGRWIGRTHARELRNGIARLRGSRP